MDYNYAINETKKPILIHIFDQNGGAIMISNDIIVESQDFNIKDILTCGQVFRYELNPSHAVVHSLDKKAVIYNKSDSEIVIESEDREYFHNYFDLDTNYSLIKQSLADMPLMRDAIKFGSGIRILRQDAYEMMISFIISANNNIPRIKGIISKLTSGDHFPSASELADYTLSDLKGIGLGYRADYLYKTSRTLIGGDFDMQKPLSLDGNTANKYLTDNLQGVGPKVADCILLFGYYKMDVFPVDTWIKKVYNDIFGDNLSPKVMRNKLISLYGDLSGYAQQYLFYNKREQSDD